LLPARNCQKALLPHCQASAATVVLSRGDPANPSSACRSTRIRGSHSRHSCLVEVASRSQVLDGLIRVRGSVAWIGLSLSGLPAPGKGHWPDVVRLGCLPLEPLANSTSHDRLRQSLIPLSLSVNHCFWPSSAVFCRGNFSKLACSRFKGRFHCSECQGGYMPAMR